jgi:hypothetical protein
MRSTKSNGLTEIERSLEKEIGGNIRALTPTSEAFHLPENGNDEMSGDNLDTLVRQISDASTRGIESLIDELHELHKKLESQGERIQSEIISYTELSQGVMRLTTIISDNVKRLPAGAPSATR